MKVSEAECLIDVTSLIGVLLLENGAEVYRAEDTMQRIVKSANIAREVDVLATPDWLFVSFFAEGNTYTKMRRVRSVGINLTKVEKLNELSRQLTASEVSLADGEEIALDIRREEESSGMKKYIGGIISAVSMTVLFGASLIDGIYGGFCSIALLLTLENANKRHTSFLVQSFLGAAVATATAALFSALGLIENLNLVVAGSIMLLFPGLSITNSMRDALSGDFVSGLTHGIQALVISFSIAIGVGFSLLLMRGILS